MDGNSKLSMKWKGLLLLQTHTLDRVLSSHSPFTCVLLAVPSYIAFRNKTWTGAGQFPISSPHPTGAWHLGASSAAHSIKELDLLTGNITSP